MSQREMVRAGGAGRGVRWWRRPWVVPLAVLLGAFLVWRIPPWVRAEGPLPLNPGVPEHYALMMAHIGFGTIAFVTVCLQLWPWLRRRHPVVHRTSGRLYVFAGILPSAVLSLWLLAVGPLTLFGKVGTAIWASLSIFTTLMGFTRARQRRYADHRRWMIYSFAMATVVITSRLLGYLVLYAPVVGPRIVAFTQFQWEGPWLSWMINFGLAAWWVRRTSRGRRRPAAAPVTASVS